MNLEAKMRSVSLRSGVGIVSFLFVLLGAIQADGADTFAFPGIPANTNLTLRFLSRLKHTGDVPSESTVAIDKVTLQIQRRDAPNGVVSLEVAGECRGFRLEGDVLRKKGIPDIRDIPETFTFVAVVTNKGVVPTSVKVSLQPKAEPWRNTFLRYCEELLFDSVELWPSEGPLALSVGQTYPSWLHDPRLTLRMTLTEVRPFGGENAAVFRFDPVEADDGYKVHSIAMLSDRSEVLEFHTFIVAASRGHGDTTKEVRLSNIAGGVPRIEGLQLMPSPASQPSVVGRQK